MLFTLVILGLITFPQILSSTVYNGWLPADRAVHQHLVKKEITLAETRAKRDKAHETGVQNFRDAIVNDPEMNFLFNQIFLQAAPSNEV